MLSDQVERKFIESLPTDEWEVETHDGWADITHSNLTIPYDVWALTLDNGIELECADTHIIIDTDFNEVFAQDSLGKNIQTKRGHSRVVSVVKTDRTENMYDLSVDSDDHLYYTNEVLSHNTLVAACYLLWYGIFKPEKLIAILANKADMASEVLHKIQVMYEMLPDWMKPGVVTYNKRSMGFANGSRIFCSATSASAIRGRAVSLLYVDELAFIPKNVADPFMASIYPTVSSGTTTKIIFSSTPFGLNHFWTLWDNAEKGKSKFVPLFIHYSEVPGRNEEWADEQRSLIGEVRFNQEYACQFLGSSPTLIAAESLKRLEALPYVTMPPDIRVYEESKEGHAYAIVVDTSRGLLADASAFSVIDVTKLPYKQVAAYSSNSVSPMLYPTIIRGAGKHYNEAMVLVEINDIGQQVADILFGDLEYENVLFTKTAGRKGTDISSGGKGSLCGIRTTKTVKAIGCTTLRDLVEQNKLIITDQQTIEELWHFNEQVNGTYKADEGYHDDHVMTLVLFAWLASKPYFNHLFDTDLRQGIFGDRIKQIEETLLPDPIISTGHESIPRIIEGSEADWLLQ